MELNFFFSNNISYIKTSPLMNQLQFRSIHLHFQKIMFNISKKVYYSQAIYVCGNIPQLGNWAPEKAFRLKWNQNDRWNGILLLTNCPYESVEFKYIVADWDYPCLARSYWEQGCYNRKLDLIKSPKLIMLDDRWNMERITINLHVNKRKGAQEEEKYYVVGDIDELGAYKQPKIMKKASARVLTQTRENLIQARHSNHQNTTQIYTFTFWTEKNKEKFCYYYIRKAQTMERQRKPGRIFNFYAQTAPHPQRKMVSYIKGEISIDDECSLNALKFSRITPKIYVGSYPKSLADIEKLKEEGITTIFSIQTQRDFKSHGLSPHYFNLLCQESGMKFKKYEIEDMNNQDFINKAQGGLRVMRDLVKQGKIYVHCSAGIYRSPQMIALYLILCEKYSVDSAIKHLKENHPYAKPSSKVIKEAIGSMKSKSFKSIYLV